MFLTIYLTCAIYGTTMFLINDVPEQLHQYLFMQFAIISAMFGWIGLVVTILHGLGYLS